MVSAVTLGMDGLMMGITALFFMLISKDWRVLLALATVWILVTLLLVLRAPESPKFLLAQGRYDEARKVMSHVAKFNGVE